MADIGRTTGDVTLYDENGNAIETINTASGLRLAVDANINTEGSGTDSFGRLRVSNPETLFDSKLLHDKDPLLWDESLVSGSGITSTHSSDKAAVTIESTLNTAGNFVRQTFQRFNYQPGKSQFILMTGILTLSGGGTGVERRIGLYDDNNGIFFLEKNNGEMYVVLRSKVSGSVVDTEILQSNWNGDQVDGTGASGVTLDFSQSQIFFIDFQWLGVGKVRMGCIVEGEAIIFHTFQNANIRQSVYMSTPNLPLRYEMTTTSSSPQSSMMVICNTIISEGGRQPAGKLRYFSNGTTVINCNNAGTKYVLLGLRLKSDRLDASIILNSVNLNVTTADDVEWQIILNPTLANAVTFNDLTNSSVQVAVGNAGNPSNSTATGGTIIQGGYVIGSSSSGSSSDELKNAILLGASIAGVRDEIYLVAIPFSSNTDVVGAISWREVQ